MKVLECIAFGDLPSLQDPDSVEEAAASLEHYQHGLLSSSAMKSTVGWVLCFEEVFEAFRVEEHLKEIAKLETGDILMSRGFAFLER